MKGRYIHLLTAFFVLNLVFSQQLFLRKGIILDSITVNDSIRESFSLYLPTTYKNKGKWPVLFVFDTGGKERQALSMFVEAAEKENYILAASNNIKDTTAISKNVLIAGRMIAKVNAILEIDKNRIYTAGFDSGGRFANLMPVFFKDIEGVISCGAALANLELLSAKNQFHFIGVIGKEDFNYSQLLSGEKLLNNFKFQNNLLVFDGGRQWPPSNYLEEALRLFTLSVMAKGIAKDSVYVSNAFKKDLELVHRLKDEKKMLLANRAISEMLKVYRTHTSIDTLKSVSKSIRKDKLFKSLRRDENAAFFKEKLLKEDYAYYLEEDLNTYNYNNLGWWNYQMTELNKFIYGDSKSERQMGKRLHGFVNALIEGSLEIVKAEEKNDDEALILLSMLKTIAAPKDYNYYLDVIALSCKYEDYGTALFYLEEALKKGFKEKELLDKLDNTALFRITPEYNALMKKYLDEARYEPISE